MRDGGKGWPSLILTTCATLAMIFFLKLSFGGGEKGIKKSETGVSCVCGA